MAPSKII
jgi:hypothetical protein